MRPPQTPDELLQRAARLSYSRSSEQMACDPKATSFCLTGLIERANRGPVAGLLLSHGDSAVLSAAKDHLCRRLRAVHLDIWEAANKPTADQVREILGAA